MKFIKYVVILGILVANLWSFNSTKIHRNTRTGPKNSGDLILSDHGVPERGVLEENYPYWRTNIDYEGKKIPITFLLDTGYSKFNTLGINTIKVLKDQGINFEEDKKTKFKINGVDIEFEIFPTPQLNRNYKDTNVLGGKLIAESEGYLVDPNDRTKFSFEPKKNDELAKKIIEDVNTGNNDLPKIADNLSIFTKNINIISSDEKNKHIYAKVSTPNFRFWKTIFIKVPNKGDLIPLTCLVDTGTPDVEDIKLGTKHEEHLKKLTGVDNVSELFPGLKVGTGLKDKLDDRLSLGYVTTISGKFVHDFGGIIVDPNDATFIVTRHISKKKKRKFK